MTINTSFMKWYFNYIYNPAYDFSVGKLDLYKKLQQHCVELLQLQDNDAVLCVGLGTGNEIPHILLANSTISLTGIDYSPSALKKATRKAKAAGKDILVLPMDIHHLSFPDNSFNKVLCIHVMDFINDRDQAAGEIFRVLREGGQFVVTFPSKNEGMQMGLNALKGNINSLVNTGHNRFAAFFLAVLQLLTGVVYLPLFLRPKKSLSQQELKALFDNKLFDSLQNLRIEDYPLYNDFIAIGTK